MNSPKTKSVNLTCRIEKSLYDELLSDAHRKGISLNSLIASIAKYHITWKRYADEIGFVPLTKRMIGKIFKQLDEKTIENLAYDLGGSVTKELLFLIYDEIEFEKLMHTLEINALRFGSIHHSKENNVHSINIHHGINENFSNFLALAHQKLADDLSLQLSITNSDKNMICMKIVSP